VRAGSKRFFFEKKKQKTFLTSGHGSWGGRSAVPLAEGVDGPVKPGNDGIFQYPRRNVNKVFLVLFVHKKYRL
jgi:hypothetical protein